MYCPRCNNELDDGSNFCRFCGATLDQSNDAREEQEFLDTTHRLLRWERKAWSISGKVFLIVGIVFAAFFGLLGFIALIALMGGDESAFVAAFVGLFYGILFGGMFIAIGIVCNTASNKIPQYLDNMYNDFLPTRDRCGSIGMIVFTALFNEIALVFFIINFVRMKSCKNIINRILNRQARILPPN